MYFNLESIPATADKIIVSGLDRTHDPIVKKQITFKVEEKRFVTARMSITHGTDGITKACGNVRLNNFAHRAECADIDVEIGSNQMVSNYTDENLASASNIL
ncbi:unnamed protein product [Schistosoma margrebowiei]|uniref:Uncharacterized protein n=1 Tax=Schistosoma margrebowiei TaxID=48269 RepID=A0AA85APK2_9TREM|nr:unnamed protein product [Schistosoma margrebowiei]